MTLELYIAVGTNLEDGLVTVVNGHHADRWLESPLKFPVRFSGDPSSKWPAIFVHVFFFLGGPIRTTYSKWEWLFWNTLPLMLCCLTLLPPPKRMGHTVRKKSASWANRHGCHETGLTTTSDLRNNTTNHQSRAKQLTETWRKVCVCVSVYQRFLQYKTQSVASHHQSRAKQLTETWRKVCLCWFIKAAIKEAKLQNNAL